MAASLMSCFKERRPPGWTLFTRIGTRSLFVCWGLRARRRLGHFAPKVRGIGRG